MRRERWVFTVAELALLDQGGEFHGEATDEFIAYPVPQAPQHGVIVQRDGTVTNRFADGTVGVPEDQQELANECESLWTDMDQDGLAEDWRDVLVEDTGEFIRLVEAGPPIAGYWVIALCPGGEEMHWGKDGDTMLPYTTEAEAADQCEYLNSSEAQCREEDRLYIVTIFTNGQMLWREYDR
jgi:hypothetical protein